MTPIADNSLMKDSVIATNYVNGFNIDIAQKSKPTIASTNLQYTASTHDHTQTLELDHTPENLNFFKDVPESSAQNFERDFPVEVMAPDSLNNTPTLNVTPSSTNNNNNNRLVRTYSETETTNFNSTTGTRLFDDTRHRPYHGFPSTRRVSFTKNLAQTYGINNDTDKAHLSYINYTSVAAKGIEDEYIPDFKFGDNLLDKWFDDDDEVFSSYDAEIGKKRKMALHTDLNPISVPEQNDQSGNGGVGKIDFNSLQQSLPENFKDLPFSQRKKLLAHIYPNYSYGELTSMIKNYVKTNSNTSLNRLSSKSSSSSIAASYLSGMRLQEQQLEYDINKKGAIVLNHQLLDIVGRGAWGVIRECKDLSTNELRAVKIISIQNEHVRKLFMNEINIWSTLHHENILPLLISKETKKNLFAITKLNYGGTLFELIYKWGFVRDHKVDTKERESRTLKIVRQILQGLKYMHQEVSLLHGDLKLENILTDPNDKIMICDFGMTKYLNTKNNDNDNNTTQLEKSESEEAMKTTTQRNDAHNLHDGSPLSITAFNKLGPSLASTILKPTTKDPLTKIPDNHIGSLPYAAPELLTADVEISPKQDVWAMGVLMYAMLVGELPFKHDYEPRLKMMILKGAYDKSALEEEYGSESRLVKAIYGCLQKDINERWSTDDLVDLLCKD